MAIAEAFTTQDPDGNEIADSFALALTKNLQWTDAGPGTGIGGFGNLTGFANMYGAHPGIWIKDSTGKTVYGSIQPEMKVVLQKMQDMYNAGMLDKEFAVKDMMKAQEATAAGKCGMEFGQMWNPFFPLQFTLANDPNADWQSYPIPTATSSPAKVSASYGLLSFAVVNKNFKNPEALIKIANLFTEMGWGETADPNMMNGDGSTYVPFKYAPGASLARKEEYYSAQRHRCCTQERRLIQTWSRSQERVRSDLSLAAHQRSGQQRWLGRQ